MVPLPFSKTISLGIQKLVFGSVTLDLISTSEEQNTDADLDIVFPCTSNRKKHERRTVA